MYDASLLANMKLPMILFFSVFFAIYGSINYYIGIRGWQAFGRYIPQQFTAAYWIAFWIIALSYLIGRFGEAYSPSAVSTAATFVGSFWLGLMLYLFLILVLIDLVRLANAFWHFLPASVMQRPDYAGFGVLLICLGLLAYGTWNAWHPIVRHYDVTIDKPAGSLKQLHIVMASDIHLGNIVRSGRLRKLVHQINALHPDIVLLPGDTIDENVRPYLHLGMPGILRGIHSRFGTYAVYGNHEYIGGQAAEARIALEQSHVTLLRDNYVKIANSFYLIGRDDRSSARFNGHARLPLVSIMAGIDKSLPLLLMDHQPFDLSEAQHAGMDLQLSGHTHHGQIFPLGYITQAIYEMDWGYLRKGAFQVIVSCGYGTWGPPMRIGNTPELLDVVVHFVPQQTVR